MADRAEIERQVKEFLLEQIWVEPERLTAETRIEHDLGVTGDDAEAIMEQFQVDMSEFEFKRYFGGCNLAVWSWCRLFTPQLIHTKPITVDNLVEAAMQKKWLQS